MNETEGKLSAIIRYRIEASESALSDARDMFKQGRYSLSANRLYYSLYYIVSALLLTRGITAKTHAGLLTMFNREFVIPGVFTSNDGALYRHCLTLRQSSDYADFIIPDRADIDEILSPTIELVGRVKEFIEENVD